MPRHRRRRVYTALDSEGDINLTPLLDIIFNLVFFFVVATNIRTDEAFYELVLPQASQAATATNPRPLPELAVDAEGNFLFDGRPMDGEPLLAALRAALPVAGERKAVLASDGRAEVRRLVAAMDVLREAGFEEIIQRVRPE
jgi:biopolymer transport protein ExbD